MSAPQQRHSTRLKDYDYTQAGAYFITLCAYERQSLFGEIVGGVLRASEVGKVVQECWDALPSRLATVELDAFVVMPNHVHGILRLSPATVGAQRAAPLPVVMRVVGIRNDGDCRLLC